MLLAYILPHAPPRSVFISRTMERLPTRERAQLALAHRTEVVIIITVMTNHAVMASCYHYPYTIIRVCIFIST